MSVVNHSHRVPVVGRGARRAAVIAASGFVGVAAFQVALALGAPLGLAAWGGHQPIIPAPLRVGSAVAAVVLITAAVVVLGRAGLWGARFPERVFRVGTWFLAGLMSLSTLADLVSPSPWERYLMGAISLTLAVLCAVVARARRMPSSHAR